KKEYQFEGVKGKILTFSFLKISLTIFIFVSMVFSISFFIYVFKDIFFKIFRNDEIKHLCELNWHIATFIMIIAYVFIFYKNDFYILKSNFARLTIVQIFYIFALCIFFCGLAKLSILSLRRNYDFTNFHDRIKRFYLQSYFIKIIETDDLSILRQKIEGINKEPLVLSLYTPNLGFRGEEVKELNKLLEYLKKETYCYFPPHEKQSEFFDLIWIKSDEVHRRLFNNVLKSCNNGSNVIDQLKNKNLLKKEKGGIRIKLGSVKYGYVSLYEFLIGLTSSDNVVFIDLLNYLKIKEDNDKILYKLLEENTKENFYLKNNIYKMKKATNRFLLLLYFFTLVITFALLFLKASGDIKVATGFFSAIFSLSLIFHSTFINTLNNLIFIFIMHPYDIGDRVLIYFNDEEHNLVVTELNINTTHFIRFDGSALQMTNYILLKLMIINISRSENQMDRIELQVSHFSSDDKINKLFYEVKKYVNNNSNIYLNKVNIFYDKIIDCNKLNLLILVQYKKNWHNWETYLEKRSKLIRHINHVCINNKIEYKLVTQPITFGVKEEEEKEKEKE
ncbi:hypothetical protein H311_03272, partial [Anncaliia algerae PRA109]